MNGEELLAALGIDTRNGNGVVSADLHFRPTALPTLTVEYAVGPLEEQRAISHVQTHRYELRDVTFRAPGDDAEVRSQMMRYIRAQYGDDGPPPPRRLGKLPYQHDRRTLHLATYISQPLPAAPATWTTPMAKDIRDWPMYGNDRLGDCTCAAAAHLIECWTSAALRWEDVPEAAVIAMYEAITGGQDTGAVELDVLRYWRKIGLAGHKPYAFALIDRMAHEHVKLAASLFAGVYIGIALPKSAQSQTGPGKVWDIPTHGYGSDSVPGTWGGHAVNVVAYDGDGLTVVTWGQLQRMTWQFWDRYVDECWALLPAEWATTPPKIAGFNFARFDADLARVGKETS